MQVVLRTRMYCTGFARRAIKMKVQNYTRKLCIEKKNTEYLCLHDQIEHFFLQML